MTGYHRSRAAHRRPDGYSEERLTHGHIRQDSPPRVLVAEDNATNRFVMSHFLTRIGLDFEVSANGAAAVAAWEAGRYDIVLMDIEMPVMDGYEAAQEMRRLEVALGRAATPIIALTADAMPESLETARRCGMDDFITKPIELERLHRAIRRALAPAAPQG